jgi:sulfate adenylyltransferase subunit 2
MSTGTLHPTPPRVHATEHLDALTDEAITIIREVATECENPVLLFSGGKDSAVLLHLAVLAFAPARLPFPVLHVDTGHNFPEVYEYRDQLVAGWNVRLEVAKVQDSIDRGRVVEDTGPRASRNRLQSVTLLDALAEHGFDAAFGGGRRDEDKARAKERILSFRDRQGRWDPRQQRPEPWDLLNPRIRKGEHLRAFPLSNWTELDIWRYIERHDVPLPSIYFTHERDVVERDGMLLAVGGPVVLEPGEAAFRARVRYRTVGDASCTGAVESAAANVADVITEVAAARITERGATRADDTFSESAMEDRKREGYF